MNEKDTEDLFKYLEDISVRLQRMNRHMVFYTIVLVVMLVLQIIFRLIPGVIAAICYTAPAYSILNLTHSKTGIC